MKQPPEFKVGDIVGSKRTGSTKWHWIVSRIEPGLTYLEAGGQEYPVTDADLHYIYLVKSLACDHDWQRVTGFRFDSFCCTKCPVTRPFDVTKDDAA